VLTIVLGVLTGTVVYLLVAIGMAWPIVWCVVLGLLGFLLVTILINLWIKKRLEAIFTQVQKNVAALQDQLRRKINLMQNKMMMGGGKGLQQQLEKEQAEGIREALKTLDAVVPLQKWNLLALRQTNTLRAQLYYQIKDFDKADACLAKCLIMDPLTLTMRMARQHVHGERKALAKTFRKGLKRYKDENAVMLYALYSWILVKEQKIDEAVALLSEAKDKTENEVLRTNWEHLANGRVRHFSNAGLGDQWYALHLETPKPVKVKQRFRLR